jgi:hypothetical protein
VIASGSVRNLADRGLCETLFRHDTEKGLDDLCPPDIANALHLPFSASSSDTQ